MPPMIERSGPRRIPRLLSAIALAFIAVTLAVSPALRFVGEGGSAAVVSESGYEAADARDVSAAPALRSAMGRADIDRSRDLDVLLPLTILVALASGLIRLAPRRSIDVGMAFRRRPFHGPVPASRAPPVLALSFR